jgi:hypothetical protein
MLGGWQDIQDLEPNWVEDLLVCSGEAASRCRLELDGTSDLGTDLQSRQSDSSCTGTFFVSI